MLKERQGWIECSLGDPLFNFIWKPFSSGIDFNELDKSPLLQMANHLEKHKEISRKSNLLFNLQQFAEVISSLSIRKIMKMSLTMCQ